MFYDYQPIDLPFFSTKQDLFFVDIETTGLCKLSDTVAAITLLHYTPKSFIVYQWLIEKKEEEFFLIEQFLSKLKSHSPIYTYGTFEKDFLYAKCTSHALLLDSSLHWINLKQLPTFKQLAHYGYKSRSLLEGCTQYKRTFQSSGRALAKLVTSFLSTQTDAYKQIILGHSREEILSLMSLYGLHQFLMGMSTPLSCMPTHTKTYVSPLIFTLTCKYPLHTSLDLVLPPYNITYTPNSTTLQVAITPLEATLVHYLDPKQYFFVDGQLLPRSLAQFLPTCAKQKPKKEQCVLIQKGHFLPCTESTSAQLWYDSTHASYLLANDHCDFKAVLDTFTKTFTKTKK